MGNTVTISGTPQYDSVVYSFTGAQVASSTTHQEKMPEPFSEVRYYGMFCTVGGFHNYILVSGGKVRMSSMNNIVFLVFLVVAISSLSFP